MKRLLAYLLPLLLFAAAACAQPAPPPSPWIQAGTAIYTRTTTACVTIPQGVTGGCQGAGTINASGLFVNGVPVGTSGGSVSTVSVATANGFAGTVADASTTPIITIKTGVTGILKGNGTAVTNATAGTDYVAPGGSLGTPSSGNAANITNIQLAGFATQGANTIVANASGSTNVPSAISVPSCSTSNNFLQWVSGTGFQCAAATGGGGGGSPGGSNTNVQYNASGSFAGSANLTWDNSNNLLGLAGSLVMSKISDPATAAGAGKVKLLAVAGTNSGTCKIIMYAGTNTTPTTIIDNVGGGC